MKILLIEDEEKWRTMLVAMLVELNYNDITICTCISEALAFLGTHQPDLLISDIILGSYSIFDLEQLLLQKKIPCIFVSAYPNLDNFEKAMHLENVQFLVKPFHLLTLKSLIKNLHLDTSEANDGIFVSGKYRQKIFLSFDTIMWLEAHGNYTLVITSSQKKHIIKKSLIQISAELDHRFIQIQRALYVNSSYINRIALGKGEIFLPSATLKIGRIYRSSLIAYLDKKK